MVTRTTNDCRKVGAMAEDQRMTGDGKTWSGRSSSATTMPQHRPASTIPVSTRAMSTQQQRRTSLSEGAGTDDDIPDLQSPSDSSESEDEPTPQPPPTDRQRTVPLHRPLANVFDSDDSDVEITEDGTVPWPLDSWVLWLTPHTLISASFQTYNSRGAYCSDFKNTRTHLHPCLHHLLATPLAWSLPGYGRPYSFPAPARTKTIVAVVGVRAETGGRM